MMDGIGNRERRERALYEAILAMNCITSEYESLGRDYPGYSLEKVKQSFDAFSRCYDNDDDEIDWMEAAVGLAYAAVAYVSLELANRCAEDAEKAIESRYGDMPESVSAIAEYFTAKDELRRHATSLSRTFADVDGDQFDPYPALAFADAAEKDRIYAESLELASAARAFREAALKAEMECEKYLSARLRSEVFERYDRIVKWTGAAACSALVLTVAKVLFQSLC